MLPESGTQEVLSIGISIQGMCPHVGGDTVEPLSPWIMESQLPQGWVIAGAESSLGGDWTSTEDWVRKEKVKLGMEVSVHPWGACRGRGERDAH